MAVPTEVEAKLLIPHEAALRALARLKHIGDYPLRSRGIARLHSIYVDTAELTLARHRIALRLRSYDGRWEMTAKYGGKVTGVVHARSELTVPLEHAPRAPYALPKGELHDQLHSLVAGRALNAVLVSDIRRRVFDVLPADGDADAPLAELALDRVHLHAAPGRGTASAAYFECEIELRQGNEKELGVIVRRLRREFGLTPSGDSKFTRGMSLIYGPGLMAAIEPTAVRPRDDASEAVRKILARQLERIRKHDPGTRRGDDSEALHDMRVATRRARAAVRIFADGLHGRQRKQLGREIRWLARLLGGVRDFDVQLEHLDGYVATLPSDQQAALKNLHDHLAKQRATHRALLLEGLDSPRYLQLLTDVEALTTRRWAQSPPHASPEHDHVAVMGRRAIRRAYRRLVKRGHALHGSPSAEDLHALRIRSKRLRYLLEFLRELINGAGRRLIKQLVTLQDILGAHQDAIVAVERVREYVRTEATNAAPAELAALDALVGYELRAADRARDNLLRAWSRFSSGLTVTDLDALLEQLATAASTPA